MASYVCVPRRRFNRGSLARRSYARDLADRGAQVQLCPQHFGLLSIPKFPDLPIHNISDNQAKWQKQKAKVCSSLFRLRLKSNKSRWRIFTIDTGPQRPPSTRAPPAEPHRPASTPTSRSRRPGRRPSPSTPAPPSSACTRTPASPRSPSGAARPS